MRYNKNSSKLKTFYVMRYMVKNTNKDNPVSAVDIIEHLSTIGIPCERKSVYRDISVLKNIGINIYKTGHSFYYEAQEGDFLHEITNGL